MNSPQSNDGSAAKYAETKEPRSAPSPVSRETFTGEIQEKLSKVEARINEMKRDSSRLAGDMKKKAEDNLAKLETKYRELTTKFEESKSSAEDKWSDHKGAFEKSFQELASEFKGIFTRTN